ncbi:UNVERIFIED_CONTAM: hypothetical protein K2H54_054501 [Gekko kuhli]
MPHDGKERKTTTRSGTSRPGLPNSLPPESFVLPQGDLHSTLQPPVFPPSTLDDRRIRQRVPRGRRQNRRQEEVVNEWSGLQRNLAAEYPEACGKDTSAARQWN